MKILIVYYSTYGIRSQPDEIEIIRSRFRNNGQDVAIEGKPQLVVPNVDFTYKKTVSQENQENEKKFSFPDLLSGNKKVIRYTALAAGAAGIITGTLLLILAVNDRKEYEGIEVGGSYTVAEVEEIEERYYRRRNGSIAGFTLGGLSFGGFALTFTF